MTTTTTKSLGRVVDLGRPWRGVGPFIFAVRHLDNYPVGKEDMSPVASTKGRTLGNDFNHPSGWSMYHGDTVPGFPSHPHRGFETISIVRNGYVDHADSTGAGARYGRGDIQWVTAGKGVNHSEMFPLVHTDKKNTMEMYQLWINLPKKSKMVPPEFVMMWREDVPVVTKENAHGAAKATIIAGKWDNVEPRSPPSASWASDPEADVAVWLIDLEPHASIKLPAMNSPKTKRMLYVHGQESVSGNIVGNAKVNVGGTWVDDGNGFEQTVMERVTLTAGDEPVHVLVLQGAEIGEPVVQHGPFVMNSQKEIQEAFTDYRRDRFGGWPWPSDQPVYERTKPRFAKFPDGKEEYPEGREARL